MLAPRVLPESTLELFTSTKQSREHGPDGRAGDLSDFPCRVTVDVGEDQGRPVRGVQPLQHLDDLRIVEELDEIQMDTVGVREGIFVGDLVEEVEVPLII